MLPMKTAGPGKAVAKQPNQKREVRVFSKKAVAESNARMKSPDRDQERSRRIERSRSPRREKQSVLSHQPGLREMVKSAEVKRRKARERQRKYHKKLRAANGERTILETASVSSGVRKDYANRLNDFYQFASFHLLPLRNEAELDIAVSDFMDELYLNGEGVDAGNKLRAALEYDRPEAARAGSLNLPKTKSALKGWRKLAPGQTRMPMLEFLKSGISGVLIHLGFRDMALFNEISFSTYAHPGELLRLMPEDVVPRNNSFAHDVLILGPIERGQGSKAGIYDETLILDDTRAAFLGPLMVQLAKRRIKEDKLWDFTAASFLKKWRQAVEIMQIADVAHSPYQNRHGGASRDLMMKLRSLPAIQRKGRWASDASARIYGKPGRLQQLVNQYSRRLEAFGEDVRKNFQAYYLRNSIQLPRSLQQRINYSFQRQEIFEFVWWSGKPCPLFCNTRR